MIPHIPAPKTVPPMTPYKALKDLFLYLEGGIDSFSNAGSTVSLMPKANDDKISAVIRLNKFVLNITTNI